MIFDGLTPYLREALRNHPSHLKIIVNIDLMGRVRLIVPSPSEPYKILAEELSAALGKHGFTPENMLLDEEPEDFEELFNKASPFPLADEGEDLGDHIRYAERMLTSARWEIKSEEKETEERRNCAKRIVFHSIKGGVGRSTALAVTAWHFSKLGKRVLVVDLDLESPGLSSALLSEWRSCDYGLVDWLIEDLVDNGDAVFENIYAERGRNADKRYFDSISHSLKPSDESNNIDGGDVLLPKVDLNKYNNDLPIPWGRPQSSIPALEPQNIPSWPPAREDKKKRSTNNSPNLNTSLEQEEDIFILPAFGTKSHEYIEKVGPRMDAEIGFKFGSGTLARTVK